MFKLQPELQPELQPDRSSLCINNGDATQAAAVRIAAVCLVHFSRTHSVCDYVFIDGKSIDKVNAFQYLGTFFGANLKWSINTAHYFYIGSLNRNSVIKL